MKRVRAGATEAKFELTDSEVELWTKGARVLRIRYMVRIMETRDGTKAEAGELEMVATSDGVGEALESEKEGDEQEEVDGKSGLRRHLGGFQTGAGEGETQSGFIWGIYI